MLQSLRERRQKKLNREFQLAVFWKHTARIQALLSKGADVDARGMRQYPLGSAIEGGDAEVIALLLDAGADPRMPFRADGREISMYDAAIMLNAPPRIIDRIRAAEEKAIKERGPGPALRDSLSAGFCALGPK